VCPPKVSAVAKLTGHKRDRLLKAKHEASTKRVSQ
jgi:hypothetical protein